MTCAQKRRRGSEGTCPPTCGLKNERIRVEAERS